MRLCLPYLLQDICNVIMKGQALLATFAQSAGWLSTNALCCDSRMIFSGPRHTCLCCCQWSCLAAGLVCSSSRHSPSTLREVGSGVVPQGCGKLQQFPAPQDGAHHSCSPSPPRNASGHGRLLFLLFLLFIPLAFGLCSSPLAWRAIKPCHMLRCSVMASWRRRLVVMRTAQRPTV